MASNKDMKQLRKRLTKQGFTIEPTRNGHHKVIAPCGARVVIAGTPSDHRGIRNTVAALKRLGYDPRA